MNRYKIRLEEYPKPRWILFQLETRELTANDKAAGFDGVTWRPVTELHTRVETTAKREARKILNQRHPQRDFLLVVQKEAA